MLDSIFSTVITNGITPASFAACTAVSLISGLLISLCHGIRGGSSKGFAVTTALLPFAKTGIAAQLRKAGALVSEEYVPEGLLIHARVEPREMALIKPYIVENNSESENV